MSNKQYWNLTELNVIKKNEDEFELLSNGTHLKLDKEAAITILSMNGTADYKRWQQDVKKHEHDIHVSISKLKSISKLLDGASLVDTNEVELQRMDYEKVIENIDKFKRGPLGISNILISITDVCPYSCCYCFRQPIEVGKPIDKRYIEDTIKDLEELGCRLITFSGGEPSLAIEDVIEYVEIAKNAGIMSRSLATRGYKINKRILKKLKNAGLTDIVISLDSSNKIQDDISKYEGTFSKSISAIRKAKETGLRTAINFTYFGHNMDEIEPTAKLATELGVKIKVTPFIQRGKIKPLNIDQVKELEKKLEYLLEERGYNVASLLSRQINSSYNTSMMCEAGVTRANIEQDGNVSGCSFVAHLTEAIVGNIKKDEFLKLWLEGDWSFYRDDEPINERCGMCSDRKYCVNNCIAAGDALFNDPKMLNIPNCNYKKGEMYENRRIE